MIAPVQPLPPPSDHRAAGLATARRTVAAMLWGRIAERTPAVPRVRGLLVWAFVGWVLAFTASYFALFSWWTIDRY